jgi:signal transduction histidine kinase
VGYRQRVIARLFAPVSAVFRPLGNPRLAHADDRLPAVSVLRRAATETGPCAECGPALTPRYYFRLTLADSSIEVDGPPLPAARRAFLAADLAPLGSPAEPRDWDVTSTLDTLVDPAEIVYVTVWRGADGRPRAVYGFAVSIRTVVDVGLVPPLRIASLLPIPTRTAPPNDSVLGVEVVTRDGGLRLALTQRVPPPTYASRVPGGLFLGGLDILLALDPQRAPPLLIGGLPPSRTGLLVVLVTLATTLVAATLFVAWRALELAHARENFVASVSHELRTPLAQILLFGETLSHGRVDSRREVRTSARIIVGEARRLMHLVENILSFRRGAWTARARAAEPVADQPLAPLVRDAVAGFAQVAAAAGSRIRVERCDEVTVPVHRDAIRQILLNLLDNAVKYGPRDQTICVELAEVGGRAQLSVEDTGPGIPRADRQRVWEPFVRLQRDVDAQIAGSGIGLSVVRDAVARHGGSVAIGDAPNGGARVTVELPGARVVTASSGVESRSGGGSVECAS